MIGFTLTDQQKAVQQGAVAVAKDILAEARAVYSQNPDQLSRFRSTLPIYRKLVNAGLVKAQVPVTLGGSVENCIDWAIVFEELYPADHSLIITILGTGFGLLPLILGGSPEQQKKYLQSFITCDGEPLCSLVHSEPGGTANWLEREGKGLGVNARREGDFYIVNGERLWITNSAGWDGKGATLNCLSCRYSETGGPQSPDEDPVENAMILLVTRNDVASNEPGAYELLAEPNLMGHPAASGPHTRYTDFKAFAVAAALIGAMAVRTMRKAFEAALKFAKEDARGGSVPIIERQSVADLLINIKMRIDTSRLMVWKALDVFQNGPGNATARLEQCVEAKIYCSEQAVPAVTEAMSAVGITAYAEGTAFPQLLNEAMVLLLISGGNIGIRRGQVQKIMRSPEYKPWASTFW